MKTKKRIVFYLLISVFLTMNAILHAYGAKGSRALENEFLYECHKYVEEPGLDIKELRKVCDAYKENLENLSKGNIFFLNKEVTKEIKIIEAAYARFVKDVGAYCKAYKSSIDAAYEVVEAKREHLKNNTNASRCKLEQVKKHLSKTLEGLGVAQRKAEMSYSEFALLRFRPTLKLYWS